MHYGRGKRSMAVFAFPSRFVWSNMASMRRRTTVPRGKSALVAGMSSTNAFRASSQTGTDGAPPLPADPHAADRARRLIRACDRATLTTIQRQDGRGGGETAGWPYPSLVLVACDHDGSPLLLISNLADHTRNIADDARVGLLFDGTAGLAQPLTGARLSVLGRIARSDEPRHRDRFLRRHPDAALYAGFADFALYRVAIERAHLVAGFGRIHWLTVAELNLPALPLALAEAEVDIIARMTGGQADALARRASVAPGSTVGDDEAEHGWTMTGIDPEGCDLRRGGYVARVDFEQRTTDPESARMALAALAQQAGEAGDPGFVDRTR